LAITKLAFYKHMGLFSSEKSYLGIDIGSSSIKMVELKKEGKKTSLVNYAFSEEKKIGKKKNFDSKYISGLIDKIYKEGGFKSSNAIATLPTSAVFSSVINLSDVDKNNLDSAVEREAKKVIPTSLEDMTLDWQIIKEDKKGENIKIFLTGSPKKMIEKYINIFKNLPLNLLSLETEIFSLIRSLALKEDSVVMVVEMGMFNTDISVIKKKIPVLNRSVDSGGYAITESISENLNISLERAEQFKYDLGVSSNDSEGEDEAIPEAIIKTLKPVVDEIKYVVNLFENNNEKEIESVILTGGSSFLPNLTKYIADNLNKNVMLGDPWYNISHLKELEPTLNEVGPRLAVAIGSAMREIK